MTTPAWQEKELQVLAPSRSAAATATQSANIDTDGAGYAKVRVNFSSELNTNNTGLVLSLLESDDTVVTNFATVVADQTIDNTAAGQATYNVDLRGRKRYLRLVTTPDTTSNGTVSLSANATLYRLPVGPSSTSEMTDDSTNDVVVNV